MPELIKLGLSIGIPISCGVIGGLATSKSVSTWYKTLNKPSFTPPGWVFGPAWTALYTMMGVSSYLVWTAPVPSAQIVVPLSSYAVQLMLNATWSPIFFGAKKIGLALANISALWIAIAVTAVKFYSISPIASLLLVPYLGWVSFASVLNFSIWRLNPNYDTKEDILKEE